MMMNAASMEISNDKGGDSDSSINVAVDLINFRLNKNEMFLMDELYSETL